jgi:hypothetical protein
MTISRIRYREPQAMIFSRDRPGLRIAGEELIEQVTVFVGKAGA